MQPATNPLAMVLSHTILWPSVIPCTTNATVSTGFRYMALLRRSGSAELV